MRRGGILFPALPVANTAEADAIVTLVGTHRVAMGGTHPTGAVVPGTSPQSAALTLWRSRRIDRGTRLVVGLAIPVRSPLPDIPQHVIQSEGVRLLLGARLLGAPSQETIPGDVAQASIVRASGAGASGVFPLGFRRQPPAGPLAVVQRV